MLRRFLISLSAPLLLGACATTATTPSAQGSSPPATAPDNGFVTAADPRAAAAGMEMLRKGGSATDAAIATMLALTVVEPESSGIGGGGFMVRGTSDGATETFDGRETAPAAAGPKWFFGADGKPQTYPQVVLTGLSVGVPGNIALAARAHDEHGRLPWADLFGPAIRLAREGFIVNPRLHESLVANAARAGRDSFGRQLFYDAAGAAVPVGARVVNPDLAASFEAIAAAGPEAFYRGAGADKMAVYVASQTPHEAAMAPQDLASYEAKQRPSVCGTYRAYRICGMGPPSSGATTVLAMLGQLERFDLASLGPDSPVFWQLFLDSQRLAYADRELYLADGDFVDVPVKGLTDKTYLASRGALLTPGKPLDQVAPGTPPGAKTALADGDEPVEHGTSHFVAVDGAGNMISYTSTVEGAFGSGLTFGGFYLNNELTDFSLVPDKDGVPVANRVEGGKRPRSSMAPTVIYAPDGKPFMVVGAAGGATIPIQVARTIIGVIDFHMPIKQALGLPLVTAFGDRVVVEKGAFEALIPQLQGMGYKDIATASLSFRAVGAVHRPNGWESAYDPRLDGLLGTGE
ncbi:gamma-glutamyltranspeptidase [Altererythrobacter sp. B11]|uniref:gamma-glutamyltransferase n=1 Tax=Altererythrobacter sp. B11 TaxID=2060312 RepID=UPI000DC71580|nr:gamma-glutamyltransferase [Altererythrobacter sp. B11]BBC71491.1 gamma-glutamyltranspeptidase [Altererythrobacter sp. B11]